MNFYEYLEEANGDVIDDACLLAAKSLIEFGHQIIPLKKGTKEPIKSIGDKGLAFLRQHPINKFNVEFAFRGTDTDIAIMLRRDMEVIDVDTKNLAGLSEDFLSILEQANPDLLEKLVISKTPSGGLHILYQSEIIGGDPILARVNATPHPLAIVERISERNKSYIKCAPSVGYEFIRGNPMTIQMLTGEERNWLSAVAVSFNKVVIPIVNQTDADRPDSPWNVYNSQKDYTYILDELTQRGWTVKVDYGTKLSLQRPGSKQHSAYLWRDTNTLYVFSASSELKPEKCYTPFGIYTHFYHDGNVGLACRMLAGEGCGVNVYDEGRFWVRAGKKIHVKYTELIIWMHSIGYRVCENEIVKITENIISIVEERDLKSAFILELEPEVVDMFYERVAAIFSDNGGLMSMLRKLDDNFVRDTKTETWLFFKNYAVKITDTEILPLQYREVSGYIWERAIMDRNFYHDDFKGCDAERFVSILGGVKSSDLSKLIGYTISRYKDPINPRAIVLIEDIDSEDEGESQGGSGKGLLFSFVRYFRKVADFDGKNFKVADNFLYQNVDLDTNVLFIDDVERNFKFNSLFSVLTGALPVNKKNTKQVIIPFDKSPKIFITSNYAVGAMDISSKRRKYEFAVVKFFGLDREPVDEFGRQFFTEWDKQEWSRFDNYIAHCCQLYLSDVNRKDIGNITENSSERSLVSNTSKDFIDYMDGQLACNFFDFAPTALKTFTGEINGVFTTNAVDYDRWRSNMMLSEPDKDLYILISKQEFFARMQDRLKIKLLTSTKLTLWLKKWAESRNVTINTRHQHGSSFERVNLFMDWPNLKGKSNSHEEEFTLF